MHKKILKTGYAHHIERLMIIGNFMLRVNLIQMKLTDGLWKCSLIHMTGLWFQMFMA